MRTDIPKPRPGGERESYSLPRLYPGNLMVGRGKRPRKSSAKGLFDVIAATYRIHPAAVSSDPPAPYNGVKAGRPTPGG